MCENLFFNFDRIFLLIMLFLLILYVGIYKLYAHLDIKVDKTSVTFVYNGFLVIYRRSVVVNCLIAFSYLCYHIFEPTILFIL